MSGSLSRDWLPVSTCRLSLSPFLVAAAKSISALGFSCSTSQSRVSYSSKLRPWQPIRTWTTLEETVEAAFIMSGEMAVAYFKVRAPLGFFPLLNNGRLDALFCFVFLDFVFAGPGAWNLDALRQSSKRPNLART